MLKFATDCRTCRFLLAVGLGVNLAALIFAGECVRIWRMLKLDSDFIAIVRRVKSYMAIV